MQALPDMCSLLDIQFGSAGDSFAASGGVVTIMQPCTHLNRIQAVQAQVFLEL